MKKFLRMKQKTIKKPEYFYYHVYCILYLSYHDMCAIFSISSILLEYLQTTIYIFTKLTTSLHGNCYHLMFY